MNPADTLVVVTGASGFIALHCVKQLLEAGYRVRGTVRSLSKEASVRAALGVSDDALTRLALCAADLNDDAGWDAAMKGAQFVFHVASPFPASRPKHEDELILPAREGTLRVLRAAARAGVTRTVLTSSVAAIVAGHDRRGRVFTEDEWSIPEASPPYEKSKVLAERAAWEFHESPEGARMELVAVNPSFVLGPSLLGVDNTSNEAVRKMLDREVPGMPRLHMSMVDVRDVARAHLLAMTTPGISGKRFALVGDAAWMGEMARTLKDAGYNVPTRVLPNWLVRLVALFDPTVRLVVPSLGQELNVSSQRAKEVLGWSARPMSEMVLDTARQILEVRSAGAP